MVRALTGFKAISKRRTCNFKTGIKTVKFVKVVTGFKAISMFFDEQKRFQVVVGGANDVHGDLVRKLFDFAANQNLAKQEKFIETNSLLYISRSPSTKSLNKFVNKLAFIQISNFKFIEPFQIKFSSALGISAQSSYQVKNLSKEERKLEYQ